MSPTTETMVEALADRVVGVALIIGLCFCWRQACQYWTQKLHLAKPEPPELGKESA